ncbi:MAG: four helix bundle protein [Candidatus Harrisonbacteria bacterium]|nr:four helix bundle protein [Candidatus Harrisonbacteria bacterium]
MSYKDLKSFQQGTIVYDFTVEFCHRYINPSDQTDMPNKSYRTADQMVQAARSGKQNIAEGSSERSKKSELHLLGIARASFQELLEDYEDFLRQRGLNQWTKNDAETIAIRQLSYKSNRSYMTYRSYLDKPETAANVAICLIHQTNFLLDQQIKSLEKQFIAVGDYSEKLTHQRNEQKKKEIINRFWRKFQ